MNRWARMCYQPVIPLGDNNTKITGCKRHIALSRKAAQEGSVLLKNNDSFLPLKKGTKIAIFGKGQIDYVKGGGGSGIVYSEYENNIYDAFSKDGNFDVYDSLSLYYKDYVLKAYKDGKKKGMFDEAPVNEDLLKGAREYADIAVITINRFSSEASDRKNDGTEYYFDLSPNEKAMVKAVCDAFDKVIVLLNTGAMIETDWFANNDKIKSALMIWQGGMEGADAACDILLGKVCPSGKLVDTCAKSLCDYPSTYNFYESDDYVKYTDDIFVGYRYFETVPGMKEKVVYPFGYGLSYTKFEIKNVFANVFGEKIVVSADVENVGDFEGKEVVQVYFCAPRGIITKPKRQLCAFAKTNLLKPKEKQTLLFSFEISDMASYDDMGQIEKSAWVLEKGIYEIFVGNNVRDAKKVDFEYKIGENIICQKLSEFVKPKNLGKRMTETGEYIDVPDCDYTPKYIPANYKNEYKKPECDDKDLIKLIDVAEGRATLDDFISQMDNKQLFSLLSGKRNTGVATTFGMGDDAKFGIPNAMTTDGPAGVRIEPRGGVPTTAFPVATMLACTWNTDILEEIGVAGALEAKETNHAMWLTPALNIHRSPLCGRNFEYYSEDPFVSGKMAAAMVKGIQSQNIVATPKHFACNNKETNRCYSDSIVSERALREIYIKGFEICVKESKPKLIMTAYNIINGTYASENPELIKGILKGEWGYEGLVTTDWGNMANKAKEIPAGNDIRMPWTEEKWLDECNALIEKESTRDDLAQSVKRLLELILWVQE